MHSRSFSMCTVFFLVVGIMLVTPPVEAQTDHSGTCTGTFAAAGNPHRLTGTCTVPAGQTLTIESGVTLTGQNHTLFVSGNLEAAGATFTEVFLNYQEGSGGTLRNSTLTGSQPIGLTSSTEGNAATPVIRNNTITATSVGIDVFGTAQPTIISNTITTNSIGLRYFNTAAGTARGNTIGFTPEGGSGRQGIQINQGASPVLDTNTLTDDALRDDFGIVLQGDATSAVQVTKNTIHVSSGDFPLHVGPGVFRTPMRVTVADNRFPDGVGAGFSLNGAVQVDATLVALEGQTTFVLTSTLSVNSGITLTIPAGFTLTGQNHTLFVSGNLEAAGATFTEVFLNYQEGSGGTLRNSTLTGSQPIGLTSSTEGNAATPVIRNNTITATSVGIDVFGTAQPTIISNTITTNSIGLRYFNTAAGTARGNTIGFTSGGGSDRRGVQVFGNASPLVDNNTFLDDTASNDTAVDLQVNTASTVTVTNNSICTTGEDRPFLFGANFFSTATAATVADNDLLCELGSGFALFGTVESDATLVSIDGQSTFLLVSTLTVSNGATLTIPQGITLNGQFSTLSVNGTLNIDGATLNNVFVDYRDGSRGTLQSGRFFAQQGFFNGLSITSAQVSLTDNLFEDFFTAVRLFGTADVEAENNTFRNNTNAFSIESPDVLATIMNNTFDTNVHALSFFQSAEALFSVFLDAFLDAFDTNVFLGTTAQNTIQLPSSLNVEGTLRAVPVPYSHNSMNIGATVTVTMEPGVIIQAEGFGSITVDGELSVVGTTTRPIIFTVANPKDGNRWGGLLIRNQGDLTVTRLEQCIVEFAGTDGVTLDNASIPIQDCIITDNSGSGVALQNNAAPTIENNAILQNLNHGIVSSSGSNPLVRNNSIFGNGTNGIQNNDETVVINAANNFWGDDSGPQVIAGDDRCNTLSNPDGVGEEVSDCVDFDPPIRLGPSIEGTISIVSGDGQNGTAGEQLAERLVVEIHSLLGSPLEDIEVIFSIVQGDASIVESMPVLTRANGRASATVQLGLTPGEIRIAATARDVNSPLATFMSTSGAPLLFALRATGGCARDGDVNQDGHVTPEDALQVFQHFMGMTTLDACGQAHADVHSPPVGVARDLTPGDALCIFQRFLGTSSCLDAPAKVAGHGFRQN